MTPRPTLKNKYIAERIYKVKPSGIRRFFGIAAKMPDVISLGIGADLVDVKAIRAGEAHVVTERARQFSQIVKDARAA